MTHSLRVWGVSLVVAIALIAGPRPSDACLQPLPSNVGIALTTTLTGLQIEIFGGTAFGSPMGEACGCTIGLPLGLALKYGCSVTGVSLTDPDGNDVGFGTFSTNGTTASSFTTQSGGLIDPSVSSIVGFAATLGSAVAMGQSLKLTFDLTCMNPNDPKLRAAAAKFLANSAVLGTGPVLPDGSVDVSQPAHIGFTTASVKDKCQAAKKGCVAKKASCLLGCHARAEASGTALDPLCVSKCTGKFDGGPVPAKACFTKIEAKGGCMVTNHVAAVESTVDAYVLAVVTQLDPGYPTPVLNACSSAKKRCAAKKTAGLLKCHAKAEAKAVPVDPTCIAKIVTKFDACFVNAETRIPCLTTGDVAAVEATVDAFVDDVVCQIDPTTCP